MIIRRDICLGGLAHLPRGSAGHSLALPEQLALLRVQCVLAQLDDGTFVGGGRGCARRGWRGHEGFGHAGLLVKRGRETQRARSLRRHTCHLVAGIWDIFAHRLFERLKKK